MGFAAVAAVGQEEKKDICPKR